MTNVNQPPDILFITVDCLRADALGCYGGAVATPHIDALAAAGRRFDHAYAHAHYTKPTFAAIFSGAYPGDYGGFVRFAPERPSFVAQLRHLGYNTLGVNANPWLSPVFGYDRGYDRYVDLATATPLAHTLPVRLANHALSLVGGGLIFPPYPPGAAVTDAALALLAEARSPLFLWVHYMDAHWPYAVQQPLLFGPWNGANRAYSARLARRSRQAPAAVSAADRAALWALYARGVRRVDGELGRLLAAAPAATVMLTADHGEAFQEHGRFFHARGVNAENVRVPLLLRDRRLGAGEASTAVARHIDIAPTLVGLAGGEPDCRYVGRRLDTPADAPTPAFSSCPTDHGVLGAVRVDDRALIAELSGPKLDVVDARLYDLRGDPAETRDLSAAEPERRASLLDTLRDYLRRHADQDTTLTLPEGDAALTERLRQLGYLE